MSWQWAPDHEASGSNPGSSQVATPSPLSPFSLFSLVVADSESSFSDEIHHQNDSAFRQAAIPPLVFIILFYRSILIVECKFALISHQYTKTAVSYHIALK